MDAMKRDISHERNPCHSRCTRWGRGISGEERGFLFTHMFDREVFSGKGRFVMRMMIWVLAAMFSVPFGACAQQQRLVKILVTSPMIFEKSYRPVADVFAGCILRELNRKGGLEIVDRGKSAEYLKSKKLMDGVDNRDLAIEVGEALGADIVIYSTLDRNYDTFVYNIAFLEVKKDVIQRIVNGSFSETSSPSEIGRIIRSKMRLLENYIPLPSELDNPGMAIREETVNPDDLPKSAEIDLPRMDQYGSIEQVFNYYRVFPGEFEYMKLDQTQQITRYQMEDEDIDAELMKTFSKLQMLGEFALRYNLQAYMIKDCSIRALNVLLANKVPVFFTDDGRSISLLVSYSGLRNDGVSIFKTNFNDEFDSFYLIHRRLIAILIILPKPGKKGGVARDYLEAAISRYHNDWGKSPSLVELKEGFLDIINSGMGE